MFRNRCCVLTAVAVGHALISSPAAHAATVGNIYYFGDSLTDCCWTQRYTNGGLPNWADDLGPLVGATNSPSKSTNFAIGGAQSADGNANTAIANLIAANNGGALSGFLPQVSRFTAAGVAVGPNDYAGIWIGTNDIWPSSYSVADEAVSPAGPFNRPPGIGPQPSVSTLTNYIMGNIATGVDELKADGVKNIVLLSPYDLGQSAIEPPDPTAVALATAYSNALTDAEANLVIPGVSIYFVNVESLLREVQEDPSKYGFLHTTASDSCSANDCTADPISVQDTYVFNDIIHFTSAFQALIAQDAASVIESGMTTPSPVPEPSTWAMLVLGFLGLGFAGYRSARTKAVAA